MAIRRQAGGTVGFGQAEHHIGQALDSETVLPDQLRREMIIDNGSDRSAMAGRAESPSAILERDLGEDAFPAGWHPFTTMLFDMWIPGHGVGDFVGVVPGWPAGFGADLPWRQVDAYGFDTFDFHDVFLVLVAKTGNFRFPMISVVCWEGRADAAINNGLTNCVQYNSGA